MRLLTVDLKKPTNYSVPVVACIGYFDGMHRGHQALIEMTKELAKEKQCESALITFDPDPWVTIKGLKNVQHLTTLKQRINLAVEFGIQNIILLKFTKEMSQLSPQEFIQQALGACNLQGLVCGFDFHYGYKGEGDASSLTTQAPYPVKVVQEVDEGGQKISTTRITSLIQNGKLTEANTLLGYPYRIEGSIIHGNHIGSSLGFPTANVKLNAENILPAIGVYACYAIVNGEKYQAMANLGHNPTVNYQEGLSLEVHILDFNHDIYGVGIVVEFVQYLRGEKDFKNADNLVLQLEQDLFAAKKILS